MDNNSDGLTNPTRLMCCSSSSKLALLLPLTMSNNKTLKLKTFDFSENTPFIAYSGNM